MPDTSSLVIIIMKEYLSFLQLVKTVLFDLKLTVVMMMIQDDRAVKTLMSWLVTLVYFALKSSVHNFSKEYQTK